jgi:hypothetical protein
MYQLYIIDEKLFDPKKLVCEFSSIDNIRARLNKEITKNADVKYIIEETSGHVNSYGDLIATVVEEN